MKTASFSPTISDTTRERVVIGVCTLLAIAFGIVAASNSIESVAPLFIVLFFSSVAFILPRAWLGIVLIALIPLQFYFPITESFYLRGALVFVLAATIRVGVLRLARRDWRSSPWAIPAALFIIAATISALGASNRYAALKGIYDYLPIFAAAFVIGETLQPRWLTRVIYVLVAAGVAEAMLGLIQTQFSPTQIAEALQIPLSHWFYQPNLLRERLADFSFNWILGNRVLPFGTFINGIDYALFLAAMLGLGVAWWLETLTADRRPPTAASCYLPADVHAPRTTHHDSRVSCSVFRFTHHASRITYHASRFMHNAFWLIGSLAHWFIPTICLALISIALLLTYKGSGLLALAGAGAVLVWRVGATRTAAYWLLGVVLLLGIIFFEPIVQRGAFLLQREMGNSYETGRLEIWIQALAALPQRPFFGFGLNNAGQLIAPTQSLRGGTFIAVSNSPESAYVATLVETGLIGFAVWLWFIGAILVRAYRRARAAMLYAGVLAAIVALLCGNLTVSALTTDQNGLLLGVLMGMVFAQNDHAKD